MKIVIYGGAFNPPHVGHAMALKMVLEKFPCDEIWIMPSADRADKKVGVTGNHRLEMLKIMVSEVSSDSKIPVVISGLEIQQPRPTVTYETKQELEKLHPGYEFWFLVGSDSLADIERVWVNGKKLYQEANFLVVGRPGYKLPEKVPPHFQFIGDINWPENISSTMIREKLKTDQVVTAYLNREVLDYIRRHRLY